jgi:hypothetical protein
MIYPCGRRFAREEITTMQYQRTLRCPLDHPVVVAEEEGVVMRDGIGAAQRTAADRLHDCPMCDRRFLLNADGSVEWAPRRRLDPPNTKIIEVVAQELIALFHREVPSDDMRTAMGEDGRLRAVLEHYRDRYEPHVDFDAVIERVVDAESLHSEG